MKTFFVADAHLEPETQPQSWRLFLSFLDFVQQERGNLYILGDLFDYWSNNKPIIDKYRPLLDKLGEITKNADVCFLPGNRDFLLGKKFLAQWDIKLLPTDYQEKIDDQRIFMTHGDIFWDRDKSYQRYKQIGWPLLRFLDLFMPDVIARRVAARLRNKSKKAVPDKPEQAKVMNEELVRGYFQDGVELIICGHRHKPMIKEYGDCRSKLHVNPDKTGNSHATKKLIILPDWRHNAGGYCLICAGKVELLDYR